MAGSLMPDKPYKFLDSYALEDSGIFFGRERETRVLLSDVLVNRLVVLFARTGTGKTSLINAGVRPRLKQQGYETFFVRVERDPTESARAEILMRSGFSGLQGERLSDQLENFVQVLKKPIVLFFDQFEEFFLYTYRPDPEKGRAFIADVARLYRNRDAGVHLVFSMREEFFVEMDIFRDEIPTIFHNDSNLRLRRFDRSQARDAIVHPARVFGTRIAPDLVEQLLRDLSEEARREAWGDSAGEIEPAQLQIVCDTLWEGRAEGEVTLAQYEALGRGRSGNIAQQVLYNRLEHVFDEIESPGQLALLGRLLPKLRTDEGTKYVRDVEGLAKALAEDGGVDDDSSLGELLQLLDRVRFIRRGQRDSLEVIELSHDYLVGHLDELDLRVRLIWPRRKLRQALDRYRTSGGLATPEELEAVAGEVERLGLTREEAEFLFRSGLECGYHPELWFRIAVARGVSVWEFLGKLFAGGGSIVALAHAIDLCEWLLRDEGGGAGMTQKRVFGLLEKALGQEDLTMATQETLARVAGARAPRVAEPATSLLFRFLSSSLDAGRIASSAIAVLGRIERVESIALGSRALGRDDLTREAQEALARLMGARGTVAAAATDALCDFLGKSIEPGGRVYPVALRALGRVETKRSVELLALALEVEELAPEAKVALERLSTSKLTKVRDAARTTLSVGFQTGLAALFADPSADVRERAARGRPLRAPRGVLDSTIRSIAESVGLGECVLFLGAGVHAPPPDALASSYPFEDRPPLGFELAERLAERSGYIPQVPGASPYDFRRVAQFFMESFGRKDLIEMLARELGTKKPSPMLEGLALLPFRLVLTTNFDRLFEEALRAASKLPRVISYQPEASRRNEPEEGTEDKPLLVKLHGDLERPENLVLTEDDFIDFTLRMTDGESAPPVPEFARHVLRRWPVLLVGFGLRNLDTRFLLRSLFRKASGPPLYALEPNPDPLLVRGLESRYHIRLIDEDLWSFVPDLYRAVTGKALPGFG
ncbi:MAG TPA: SIR2 family protein [Thermoanaerobaculia bacterium]|nr:SIR2 family protein [Thermoanaerobaculia bacterium]